MWTREEGAALTRGAEQPCLAPERVVLTSGAGGADGLAPSHPLRHRPDHKESRRKGEKQTTNEKTSYKEAQARGASASVV